MTPVPLATVVVLLAALVFVPVAQGQLLLSTNDNKVALVNGVATVVKSPPPDTLTVIDIKAWPPKVVAELDVPGSVVGPPFSVAVAPDESLALVTANEKLDRKSTRLNSSHSQISYAVFCLKKKTDDLPGVSGSRVPRSFI